MFQLLVLDFKSQLLHSQICFGAGATCLLVHPAPAWLNPSLIFLGGLITILIPATELICQALPVPSLSCPFSVENRRDVQVAPDAEVKHADDTGKSGARCGVFSKLSEFPQNCRNACLDGDWYLSPAT